MQVHTVPRMHVCRPDDTGEEHDIASTERFAPLTVAVVAVGGALGALARDRVAHLNPGGDGAFPAGTFVVNVSGAFLLGILLAVLARRPGPRLAKPLVATGFLGAYTTFSTFAVELVTLVDDEHVPMALVYATTTVAVGLGVAALGHRLGCSRVARRAGQG
jgi:CrcB protein